MDKAIKTLRQALHLGVFWIASCAGLFGALAYTKTGLVALIAEQSAEPSRLQRVTPATAQTALQPVTAQPVAAPLAAAAIAGQGAPRQTATAQPKTASAPAQAQTSVDRDAQHAPQLVQPPQRVRRPL